MNPVDLTPPIGRVDLRTTTIATGHHWPKTVLGILVSLPICLAATQVWAPLGLGAVLLCVMTLSAFRVMRWGAPELLVYADRIELWNKGAHTRTIDLTSLKRVKAMVYIANFGLPGVTQGTSVPTLWIQDRHGILRIPATAPGADLWGPLVANAALGCGARISPDLHEKMLDPRRWSSEDCVGGRGVP